MEQRIFPREVTDRVPLITMTGSSEICIEQHQGLLSYRPQQIVFKTASGMLTVTGSEMYFSRYSAQEASLTGRISGVTITDTPGGDAL